ncbi:MAG: hypothetical protein HRU38_10925 [Saccharospirillaceae bacterium]|nr:hypothetical protein [Saccharospirillaceae bacterium]
MAILSRDSAKAMTLHHSSSFNKYRQILIDKLNASDDKNVSACEASSMLVAINLMKEEVESLERFVLENQPKR